MKNIGLLVIFLSLTSFTCVAQKNYKYDNQSGFLAIDYYPYLKIKKKSTELLGTAIGIRYGYTMKGGFMGSLDFVRSVSQEPTLSKFWEFSYLNFGKNFNHGKRLQLPITISAGFFGFEEVDNLKYNGLKFGVHPSIRIFISNKFSLRFSSNFSYYLRAKDRNNIPNDTKSGWLNYSGVGLEYNFYK